MAEKTTIARPYAKAAFQEAQGDKRLGAWSETLRAAATAVRDPRVHELLGNPGVSGEDLLDLPPHGNARAPFKLCAWRSGVVRCHGAVIPFSSNIRCDVHCSAQAVMEI